ncbi:hypothetical protein HK097_007053 [Rhizophlyctis rosea]|uniref:B30.2/SPRY domain-containing protein n=1 Tax=Rhizophlyctis rosea TaxID=64517 RepID=A0AAD5SEA7_9FUNG|nr:hypothetical protein HK097_007053 [Rhizophlyctis rosea]
MVGGLSPDSETDAGLSSPRAFTADVSANSLRKLIGSLESLHLLLQSQALRSTSGNQGNLHIDQDLSSVVDSVINILSVPSSAVQRQAAEAKRRRDDSEDASLSDPETETDEETEDDLLAVWNNILTLALKLVVDLQAGNAHSAVTRLSVFRSIIQHAETSKSFEVSTEALATLALTHDNIPRQLLPNVWSVAIARSHISSPRSEFYAQYILEATARRALEDAETADAEKHHVRLSPEDKTTNLTLSPEGWEIRNDCWSFESIRCSHGIINGGKYAYEVILRSAGIIQIGFASKNCAFDPEAGTGVGDDVHSYAFDGSRRKKWHGIAPQDNDYGEEWSSGDVITALLDLDAETISFLRNGVDLGVAFENVSRETRWYPAISLASDQGCRVHFGSALDMLNHLPHGYEPIVSLIGECLDAQWFAISSSQSESADTAVGSWNKLFSLQLAFPPASSSRLPTFGVIDSENHLTALLFRGGEKAEFLSVPLTDEMLSSSRQLRASILEGEVKTTFDGIHEADVFSYAIREEDDAAMYLRNGSIIGIDENCKKRAWAYPILLDVARFVLRVLS